MKKANILISRRKDAYRIKVEGRSTFDCSVPLRNLAHNIAPEGVRQVAIDLTDCTGMDSTFMGVMAMIALRVRNLGTMVEIYGSNENHRHLLNGLGLKRLFNYRETDAMPESQGSEGWEVPSAHQNLRETTNTVLEAHETLVVADPENRAKFANVIGLVRHDLDKQKAQENPAEPEKKPE